MARFQRDRHETRARMLSFRASAAEVEQLRALAAGRGATVADLLRAALDEWIRKETRKTR